MSDEELRKDIISILRYSELDIVDDADAIMHLLKQHREAYALELIGDDEPQSENGLLPDRVDRRNQLRAELREKAGRDENNS